jgi:HAE1 family hydrophobic/amphiphilic exporter-1
MNVSAFFVRRPVTTLLLTLALMLSGAMAYLGLPRAALPRIDLPVIVVTAELPGASPETMANAVSTPLIKEFSTIPSAHTISASSMLGSASISIEFSLGRNIDHAAADVHAAISRAQRRLPAEMASPPTYRKFNPADAPVLLLALTSETLSPAKLNAFAETVVSPRLSTISGVGQVLSYGAARFAVRVHLDPVALAARRIGIDEVQQAITAANNQTPLGIMTGAGQRSIIQARTQLRDAAGFRDLVVARPGGRPVRLGDVARVIDSVEDDQSWSSHDGVRAHIVAIHRQPDANTIEVTDRVKSYLPSLREQLGATGQLHLVNDRSVSIRDGIDDLKRTLLLTSVCVMTALFLFVGRFRETLVPALAVPLSVMGTFVALYALGFSLNNLTLLALVLSVGLVVDDAIVMSESILRTGERGGSPIDAALRGAGEVGFTILSMTLSLVAAFIPVLFMGGIVGRLFHEFAVTVTAALLISALVSLTITPAAAAYLTPRTAQSARNAFEHVSTNVERGYAITLGMALRFRRVVLIIFVASLCGSVWLAKSLPRGFFPREDIGQLSVTTEVRPDVTFPAMLQLQGKVEEVLKASPHVAHVTSTIGSTASSGLNQGRVFVELKVKDARPSLDIVLGELRHQLNALPGIESVVTPVQNMRGGRQGRSQYQFALQGGDREELFRTATRFVASLRKDPMFVGVTSDLQRGAAETSIRIDQDKARLLGLSADQIRSTLYSGFGSRHAATIYDVADSYKVVLQFDSDRGWNTDALDLVQIRSQSGTLIPLSSFAEVEPTTGALSINQIGQIPAVTISFDLPPSIALGQALARIRAISLEENVPPRISVNLLGTTQAFQEGGSYHGLLLLAALLTIYIILGILYESFVHPLTIMSGLPAAAVGALAALQMHGTELNIMGIIGVLLLFGIAKKNAIMMVDAALTRQRAGTPAEKAICEAAIQRFRPITMTTLAALFGAIPVAIGHGAGSEIQQPLGIAVIGGLLGSQILTLFITPVLFLYFDRCSRLGARIALSRGARATVAPTFTE